MSMPEYMKARPDPNVTTAPGFHGSNMIAGSILFGAFKSAERISALLRVFTTQAAVGRTPRCLVWSLNKAKMYRYKSVLRPEHRHRIPLLLVYAPIGQPSILDLYPGHSFIDWMRRRGFDVFLLDWGHPGPEDQSLGLSGYVLEYLPQAVGKMKSITGAGQYSMLGWSIGGLFATIHAALFSEGLRNLILVTAPLDFSEKNRIPLARLVDERWFALDRVLSTFCNIPGEMIAFGAITADPIQAIVRPFLQLWGNLDDPAFIRHWHAVRTWASGLVPVTRALFRDLVVELYRNNRLIRNKLTVGNRRVDLGLIHAHLLNVIASEDLVCPPCQSVGLLELVGSRDKQHLTVPGTHVESMAGIRAPRDTWPKIQAWLAERSSGWDENI